MFVNLLKKSIYHNKDDCKVVSNANNESKSACFSNDESDFNTVLIDSELKKNHMSKWYEKRR